MWGAAPRDEVEREALAAGGRRQMSLAGHLEFAAGGLIGVTLALVAIALLRGDWPPDVAWGASWLAFFVAGGCLARWLQGRSMLRRAEAGAFSTRPPWGSQDPGPHEGRAQGRGGDDG